MQQHIWALVTKWNLSWFHRWLGFATEFSLSVATFLKPILVIAEVEVCNVLKEEKNNIVRAVAR